MFPINAIGIRVLLNCNLNCIKIDHHAPTDLPYSIAISVVVSSVIISPTRLTRQNNVSHEHYIYIPQVATQAEYYNACRCSTIYQIVYQGRIIYCMQIY